MTRKCKICPTHFKPKGAQQYCSEACKAQAACKHDIHLPYVQEHWATDSIADIARHIGIGEDSLRKLVVDWRRKGHVLMNKKTMRTHQVRYRMENGKKRAWYKKEDGSWGRVRKDKQPPKPKVKPMSATATAKQHRHERQQRMAARTFKTRTVDVSTTVPVRIPELRMVVHVAPGTDKELVVKKYKEQREWAMGRV